LIDRKVDLNFYCHITFIKISQLVYSLHPQSEFLSLKMRAIKKVRQIIAHEPQHQTAQIFARLISSLVDEVDFALKDLYLLETSDFELAMDILQEWRLDRYYMGKAKTFDVAMQALQMNQPKASRPKA
jgi:hypothetical protein